MKIDVNCFINSNNQVTACDEALICVKYAIKSKYRKLIFLSKQCMKDEVDVKREILTTNNNDINILYLNVKTQLLDIGIDGFVVNGMPDTYQLIYNEISNLWSITPQICRSAKQSLVV